MTFINEADWDRAARLLVGLAVLAAGTLMESGAAMMVVMALGGLAIITGLAGWCPAYTVCGVTTRKTRDGTGTFR